MMRRSVSPTELAQKAFVRGIPDDVDEEDLRRAFGKFGDVSDVHIAKDRETNASRGFAFITFANSTDCSKACSAMDNKEFHGVILQVELATPKGSAPRGRGRGGFRGAPRGGGFRGGRAYSPSPVRDTGFRRGGPSSSFRGPPRRGGSGRGDYRSSFAPRASDSLYSSEDRFRDPPPRDYGRYESSYDYRSRVERPERDSRDYPTYRGRDYMDSVRDYSPPRGRAYSGYYSPPRDYPPSSRDYPPSRDTYMSYRSDSDFDLAPRRYASRDYLDDYPPSNGAYDSRPTRRDYDGPSADYGASGRYDSFSSGGRGGGRGSFKSSRGSYSQRGARDDFPRGGFAPRRPPRDDDRQGGMRRSMRSPDGPPAKKPKPGEPMHRAPRGGPPQPRRY